MWAKGKEYGFTIVELLIVIVVIGVLAAIVVLAYRGVTSSAHNSAVLSDLSTMAKKLAVEKATTGRFPLPPTVSTDIHIAKASYYNSNNLYYCYNAAADEYAVQARTVNNTFYKIVDGVASAGVGAYGYSGQFTCDLLEAGVIWGGGTASLGYTQDGPWASWAQ
jgi:prepilin-type N-terminal cleavage/methylation domain-containing protein